MAWYGTGASQIRIGNDALSNVSTNLQKIRNSVRFLLGNLHDWKDEKAVQYDDMLLLDRYALSLLHGFYHQVNLAVSPPMYYKVYSDYDENLKYFYSFSRFDWEIILLL